MEIIDDNKENENKIQIFGRDFVKNNKNNCILIIDNIEVELCERIKAKNKREIRIKLKEINTINNMYCIFYGCSSLLSLPDISNWNTSNVKTMYDMFYGCSSLSSLSNISN